MLKKPLLLLVGSLFYAISAFSQLFDGATQAPATLENLLERVRPGSIVVLGENHGLAAHRDQHLEILRGLRSRGLKVSVGLEFVNYTDQGALERFRTGELSEDQFLKAVGWGGIGFEYYRPQLLFPDLAAGEKSLGLNVPRAVTSKISRGGLASLSAEERALLPGDFRLGRDSYRNRFMLVAGEHCPVPENCFAAQSAWDDTMAWRAVDFAGRHPDQVLVIVVGEFHVQFGGGLPDRIRARLPGVSVVTLSQIWAEGMLDEELPEQMEPSVTEGPRADFVWFSGR